MAQGDTIGQTKCEDCGGTLVWRESKGGGASATCAGCGEQRFKRSPRAVEALKVTLARAGGLPAAAGPAASDAGEDEPFDLTKL